jgi:hypothetical protein
MVSQHTIGGWNAARHVAGKVDGTRPGMSVALDPRAVVELYSQSIGQETERDAARNGVRIFIGH